MKRDKRRWHFVGQKVPIADQCFKGEGGKIALKVEREGGEKGRKNK